MLFVINFEVDFPPKQAMQGKSDARFGISTINWTIETTLHIGPKSKTMIVGNVTGPLLQSNFSYNSESIFFYHKSL